MAPASPPLYAGGRDDRLRDREADPGPDARPRAVRPAAAARRAQRHESVVDLPRRVPGVPVVHGRRRVGRRPAAARPPDGAAGRSNLRREPSDGGRPEPVLRPAVQALSVAPVAHVRPSDRSGPPPAHQPDPPQPRRGAGRGAAAFRARAARAGPPGADLRGCDRLEPAGRRPAISTAQSAAAAALRRLERGGRRLRERGRRRAPMAMGGLRGPRRPRRRPQAGDAATARARSGSENENDGPGPPGGAQPFRARAGRARPGRSVGRPSHAGQAAQDAPDHPLVPLDPEARNV
jgi:hypothetical protein